MARRAAPAKAEPLAVVMKRLDELEPYDRNARTHSDAQIEQLCASIRQFGWTNPILLDGRGRVVAGHGRMQAARSMGLTEVPCIELRHLSDQQRRAYILADNQLALNAGWDVELLRLELGDLRTEEFDIGVIGFGSMEVEQLFAPDIDPASEWQGMPEYEQQDLSAYQRLIVNFKDQAGVDAFAALIQQRITRQTRSTWFPLVAEDRYSDKRYATDEPAVSDLHTVKGSA